MNLSPEDIVQWKNDDVTKSILEGFKEYLINIEELMVSDSIIFAPDCQIRLATLSGERRVLNWLLDLKVEDLYEEDESESSSLSSIGKVAAY